MLNYDYTRVKQYSEELGLYWLGDDYPPLMDADKAAHDSGLSQAQAEICMFHHLRQVAILFNQKSYKFFQRLMIAVYFLTGWKPK